ncbi:hypothetical protein CJP72_00990 [Citrobacter sp. NCU1]|nr:hypothetical protein [Citrobacter sp. NCU1]
MWPGLRIGSPANCLTQQAILFAILALGSAHNPPVLRVRSGCSALSMPKLAATMTPVGTGFGADV